MNPSDAQHGGVPSQVQHGAVVQPSFTSEGGAAKEDDDFVYVKVPRLPPSSAGTAANMLPAYMVRFDYC